MQFHYNAMYQITITTKEEGQRFDKYLHRLLPNAGSAFLYKMLRKKNITLNGRKADGSEKTAAGDCVKIFFAQETLSKFMGKTETGDGVFPEKNGARLVSDYASAYRTLCDIQVIYENDHVLMADKPVGILSQKAEKTDLSLNEWLIGYLLQSGFLTADDLRSFKPSVCNRLDRNTSGIVLCAKTLKGAQLLGGLLKDRTLHKYYQLYVKGRIEEEQLIEGYLSKEEKNNKVFISKEPHGESAPIKTKYRPLQIESDKTLLEVELITGKPHQIRAHLASIGHPLLGDYKYGDRTWNESYRQKYGLKSQLLHAYKVEFPPLDAPFEDLSGRTFFSRLPALFTAVSEVSSHKNTGLS